MTSPYFFFFFQFDTCVFFLDSCLCFCFLLFTLSSSSQTSVSAHAKPFSLEIQLGKEERWWHQNQGNRSRRKAVGGEDTAAFMLMWWNGQTTVRKQIRGRRAVGWDKMTSRILTLVPKTLWYHFLRLKIQKKEQGGKVFSLVLTYENRQAYIDFPLSYHCSCHWMY